MTCLVLLTGPEGDKTLEIKEDFLALGHTHHSFWTLCWVAAGGVGFWGLHSGYWVPQIPHHY